MAYVNLPTPPKDYTSSSISSQGGGGYSSSEEVFDLETQKSTLIYNEAGQVIGVEDPVTQTTYAVEPTTEAAIRQEEAKRTELIRAESKVYRAGGRTTTTVQQPTVVKSVFQEAREAGEDKKLTKTELVKLGRTSIETMLIPSRARLFPRVATQITRDEEEARRKARELEADLTKPRIVRSLAGKAAASSQLFADRPELVPAAAIGIITAPVAAKAIARGTLVTGGVVETSLQASETFASEEERKLRKRIDFDKSMGNIYSAQEALVSGEAVSTALRRNLEKQGLTGKALDTQLRKELQSRGYKGAELQQQLDISKTRKGVVGLPFGRVFDLGGAAYSLTAFSRPKEEFEALARKEGKRQGLTGKELDIFVKASLRERKLVGIAEPLAVLSSEAFGGELTGRETIRKALSAPIKTTPKRAGLELVKKAAPKLFIAGATEASLGTLAQSQLRRQEVTSKEVAQSAIFGGVSAAVIGSAIIGTSVKKPLVSKGLELGSYVVDPYEKFGDISADLFEKGVGITSGKLPPVPVVTLTPTGTAIISTIPQEKPAKREKRPPKPLTPTIFTTPTVTKTPTKTPIETPTDVPVNIIGRAGTKTPIPSMIMTHTPAPTPTPIPTPIPTPTPIPSPILTPVLTPTPTPTPTPTTIPTNIPIVIPTPTPLIRAPPPLPLGFGLGSTGTGGLARKKQVKFIDELTAGTAIFKEVLGIPKPKPKPKPKKKKKKKKKEKKKKQPEQFNPMRAFLGSNGQVDINKLLFG